MTDLFKNPLCNAEDLGKAIPDHELGVSVCLPLWKHVIGYEEGEPSRGCLKQRKRISQVLVNAALSFRVSCMRNAA
jgi:hypothetical protein